MRHGKIKIIVTLLLFCMLNSGFQCNKQIGCGGMVYNFEMGIKAYPDEKIIIVGDTLWLEINESSILRDMVTGKVIDYSNAANLGSAIAFQKLSSTNEFVEKAARSFTFKLTYGTETNNADPESLREFLFEERNKRYVFKLGVIPKQAGTYRLFFSNAANVYKRENRCSKANFTLNFKDTDQHINLYPGLVDSTSGGGVYYFKVE